MVRAWLKQPNPHHKPISPRFFFNDTPPPAIYTLSLHDALPISYALHRTQSVNNGAVIINGKLILTLVNIGQNKFQPHRSEEHTSELQSRPHLVCRLLLEKKKNPTSNAQMPALPSSSGPSERNSS